MATYRMCEPPLPQEQAARRREGLIAAALAAATVAIGYYAPNPWSAAAAATGVLSFFIGLAYVRYAKIRSKRAYTLDDAGVRMEPAGGGANSLRWNEITAFAERNGGLLLLTADRLRRLPIPAGLEGIERFRAELVRRRLTLVEDTQQNRDRWEMAIWAAALAAAFGGIFLSRTQGAFLVSVVVGAAAMAALQWRAVRVSKRRWAGWDLLLTWIAIVVESYNHHFHGQAPRALLSVVVLANFVPAAAIVISKFRRTKQVAATAA